MKAFILTFDYTVFKAGKLNAFHEGVKGDENIKAWWHRLNGTYILITTDHITSEHLRIFFHGYFPNEYCFIMQIKYNTDYSGWLPQDAWNWIEDSFKTLN
jgi:hypothetical protein